MSKLSTKRLGKTVKPFLEKARQSALLAVEVYNKPAITFKSSAYISLMVIAWTSLFHAYFLGNSKQPYVKAKNGRFKKIDGDYAYWGLGDCLKEYWGSDTENPIRKNLEFFIPLRNKIEHRHLSELDATIFGECQSLLLNFDSFIGSHFHSKYQLRESLSFSLQLFPSPNSFSNLVKTDRNLLEIKNFIDQYRSSLSAEVFNSGNFAFKAFLIQVNNHQSKDSLPIHFVQYDQLNEEDKNQLEKLSVLVKYKNHHIINMDFIKPMEVVRRVQTGLGNVQVLRHKSMSNKFTSDTHRRCFLKYKVRPAGNSKSPHLTNTKFCIYDKPHNDYLYTKAWVDFLIDKLSNEDEYISLYSKVSNELPL